MLNYTLVVISEYLPIFAQTSSVLVTLLLQLRLDLLQYLPLILLLSNYSLLSFHAVQDDGDLRHLIYQVFVFQQQLV